MATKEDQKALDSMIACEDLIAGDIILEEDLEPVS